MKTILFDLDGTLIDSTDAIIESFQIAYDTFCEPVPNAEKIKSLIGHPLEVMFNELGIKGNVWEYVDAYKGHYRVISKAKTFLLPLCLEALDEASKIATLGIVTTKTAKYSEELLEHMDITVSYTHLRAHETKA